MKNQFCYVYTVNGVIIHVCKNLYTAYFILFKDLQLHDAKIIQSYSQVTRILKEKDQFSFFSSLLVNYNIRKYALISNTLLKRT